MATMTSQILIGSPHSNHGGIIPSHTLALFENDRPVWLLEKHDPANQNTDLKIIRWIPSIKQMLDDAILMITIHVASNTAVIAAAEKRNPEITSPTVELLKALSNEQRESLHDKCRELKEFPLLVLTILNGSTLEKQLAVLNNYKFDIEVCRSTYSRRFSQWSNDTVIQGSLT